jgi:glycosyltransferase involved in cell wall biosynthesis
VKISVITVCYNAVDTIESTIKSVLEQDYPNVEYLIIDGGSTDGTIEIINTYLARIHRFISERDNGMYDALNKGIAACTGDVVALLHADDVYTSPHVLSGVVKHLGQSDALYGDLEYVKKESPSSVVRLWKSGTYSKDSFKWGWMPPHPAFFLRKSVYERFGVFNTQFKSAADYELMLRMMYKHQIKAVYWPETLVRMRLGGKSNATIKNRMNANREDRLAWTVNQLTPFFFTLWLKPLRKIPQFFTHLLHK